jgi:DnaJ-class molecular chaperone
MTEIVCPSCDGAGDVLVDRDGDAFYEPCWQCDGYGLSDDGTVPTSTTEKEHQNDE